MLLCEEILMIPINVKTDLSLIKNSTDFQPMRHNDNVFRELNKKYDMISDTVKQSELPKPFSIPLYYLARLGSMISSKLADIYDLNWLYVYYQIKEINIIFSKLISVFNVFNQIQ